METGSISSIAENFKGSQVWLHFTKDANFKMNKIAICNYCSKRYVCSDGSITNIKNHINKFHASKLQPNLIVTSNTISSFFISTKVNKHLLIAN